jgi:hypothetical protein
MMNITEIKKELYKSKVNAKFSHYVSGRLYYIVELSDGTYQFPINTVENVDMGETGGPMGTIVNIYELRLSEDLGTTAFSAEMKGSELIRWISMAMNTEEFIKIKL